MQFGSQLLKRTQLFGFVSTDVGTFVIMIFHSLIKYQVNYGKIKSQFIAIRNKSHY